MNTLYMHELSQAPIGPTMRHYRINQHANSILTPVHIGDTWIEQDPIPVPSGLALPNIFDIARVNATRTDRSNTGLEVPIQTIECISLEEFITKGQEAWKAYLSLGKVMIKFADNRDGDNEFLEYVANPDEIDAINQIALTTSDTTPSPEDPPIGLYL